MHLQVRSSAKNHSFALLSLRIRHIVLIAAVLISAVGISMSRRNSQTPQPIQLQPGYNDSLIQQAMATAQTGDIVVRTGRDATSYMLRQANKYDKTYSHTGVVRIVNGYPMVYHCIGGEDHPLQTMQRDSLHRWLNAGQNAGFGLVQYQLDDIVKERFTNAVDSFYEAHVKYDMQFDLSSDDRMYCAEMVYKALQVAMNDSNFIHPETIMNRRYVGIDNLFANERARFVARVVYK